MKRFIFGFLLICVGIATVLVMANTSQAEYGDIVLNTKKESMAKAGVNPVVFPHWFHRIRFKCKVCHEDIFVLKKGANDINMSAIMNGEFCGKCHNGLTAWEPLDCVRCHSFGTQPTAGNTTN